MSAYQDLFWHVWQNNMPKLGESIVKCAMGKYRYSGDPQDVVQEVMLSAWRRWYDYDEDVASFNTWVLWLTKQYLNNLYQKRRLKTVSLFSQPSTWTGHAPEECIPSDVLTPEEIIIEDERLLQIWTTVDGLFMAHRNTRKGQILEAMAALIDEGKKLSTRNIAKLVGCSHGTVARELEKIRQWLKNDGT